MPDSNPVTREEFEELKKEVENIDASIAHSLQVHLPKNHSSLRRVGERMRENGEPGKFIAPSGLFQSANASTFCLGENR
jgi:hypothetical protein